MSWLDTLRQYVAEFGEPIYIWCLDFVDTLPAHLNEFADDAKWFYHAVVASDFQYWLFIGLGMQLFFICLYIRWYTKDDLKVVRKRFFDDDEPSKVVEEEGETQIVEDEEDDKKEAAEPNEEQEAEEVEHMDAVKQQANWEFVHDYEGSKVVRSRSKLQSPRQRKRYLAAFEKASI
jgi:hypothetical protein